MYAQEKSPTNINLVIVFVATEVSDLNIKSTRIQQQIMSWSGKASVLAEDLASLQAQVKRRREERAKNAPKNVEQMKTELTKLNKELEVILNCTFIASNNIFLDEEPVEYYH